MDYEELRKYQRKEKNSAKLVELKKGFYGELSDFISELESKYKEEMNPETKKKLENVRKVTRDLYKKRERKMMSRALRSTDSSEDFNLLDREEELFQEIENTISKGRNRLDNILKGKPPEPVHEPETSEEEPSETEKTSKETEDTEKPSEGREEEKKPSEPSEESIDLEETEEESKEPEEPSDEGLNKVMVKILKEVPEFVSQNLKELGPYEPDSKVELPEKEAEMLSEKGLAEKIEETKESD